MHARLSWLSGRALAAQARGLLGLIPGNCWLFHFPLFLPHNILYNFQQFGASSFFPQGVSDSQDQYHSLIPSLPLSGTRTLSCADKRGPSRGGQTLHAPIHKGSNLGASQRKLAGSSVPSKTQQNSRKHQLSVLNWVRNVIKCTLRLRDTVCL